jgi:hypothetical protein
MSLRHPSFDIAMFTGLRHLSLDMSLLMGLRHLSYDMSLLMGLRCLSLEMAMLTGPRHVPLDIAIHLIRASPTPCSFKITLYNWHLFFCNLLMVSFFCLPSSPSCTFTGSRLYLYRDFAQHGPPGPFMVLCKQVYTQRTNNPGTDAEGRLRFPRGIRITGVRNVYGRGVCPSSI